MKIQDSFDKTRLRLQEMPQTDDTKIRQMTQTPYLKTQTSNLKNTQILLMLMIMILSTKQKQKIE